MNLHVVHRDVFHEVLPADHEIITRLRQDATQLRGYIHTRGQWLKTMNQLILNARRRAQKGRALNVLDIGPGKAVHIGQFGKFAHVKVHVLVPLLPTRVRKGVVAIPGYAEETLVPDFFDFIQSRWAGIHHSPNRAVALENALNSLRPGGFLLLHHQELSDVPLELDGCKRGRPEALEKKLLKCIQDYRRASPQDIRQMERCDPFYLACTVLKELARQGFKVPTDEQIAQAHAHDGDLVIQRRRAKANLKAFYDHPNRRFNKVPV